MKLIARLLFTAFVCAAAHAGPVLEKGDLVAICGDSITEQKMYSAFIEEYLLACQPAAKLQAVQLGWGGEASWGFRDRMENDVLGFKPNVVTLCYGMNDGGYEKTKPETIERYTTAMTDIVRKFKAAGVRRIVVGTPGAVDTNSFKGALFKPISPADYNNTLSDIAKAAEGIAKKEGVIFANLHDDGLRVMEAMKKKYGEKYFLFGDDGIHPPAAGQLVMAYTFLKALGCDGDVGTITIDMASGKAEASEGHKVLSAGGGRVEIESTRYPFCFYGEPSKPDATSGVIEFLPFNQDLNRLMLVVRNAPAGKVKVTWGSQSREFDGEQLGKGINLAAEFPDNPFSEPFLKVRDAVRKQQNYETPMVKSMLHNLPELRNQMPDDRDPIIDTFLEGLYSADAELRKKSSESVVPVKHEIRVGV